MKTKGKPRGVPFQKGADDRRHLAGSKNRAALDFKAEFKRVMGEELNVRKLVRTLIRKAEQGEPWAISEVLNRGLGKPAPVAEDSFPQDTKVIIEYANTGEKWAASHGITAGELHEFLVATGRRKPGPPPVSKLPHALPPHEGTGPSPRALEAFAEGDKRRLLEAGQAGEAAQDEGQDYIKACEEA